MRYISAYAGGVEIRLDIDGVLDVPTELMRAENERLAIQPHIVRLEQLLESDFVKKAPPDIVERERTQLQAQYLKLEAIERRHITLLGLGLD